jgi:hypothetical protein
MKQHSKLSSDQQQQRVSEQQLTQQTRQDFASAEELLRYDAAHTSVPPGIAQRLAKSAADLSAPSRSWWSKLFRK